VKKLFVTVTTVLSLAALLYLPAGADDESEVEVLVTPKVIAISVARPSLTTALAKWGRSTTGRSPPVSG
jgi:hypothetical protein